MSAPVIRKAASADFDAIADIYANEVLHGLATFETIPPKATELAARWQALVTDGYPYLVAQLDEKLVGYAYASAFRTRIAYRNTVETSVYVEKNSRGKGIGKQLMQAIINECEKGHWRQMIAIVGDSKNRASVALHESLGFRVIGTLEAVGFKHNQWVDTVYTQRALGDGTQTLESFTD